MTGTATPPSGTRFEVTYPNGAHAEFDYEWQAAQAQAISGGTVRPLFPPHVVLGPAADQPNPVQLDTGQPQPVPAAVHPAGGQHATGPYGDGGAPPWPGRTLGPYPPPPPATPNTPGGADPSFPAAATAPPPTAGPAFPPAPPPETARA
ncbi:hypothetical protein [Saccharothrix sp. HUAS TT1]|uniref:hypothetical protein n=1 Tax=unclassified Saccharothrix TaxID=2593673 RepID=UPI00345C26F3